MILSHRNLQKTKPFRHVFDYNFFQTLLWSYLRWFLVLFGCAWFWEWRSVNKDQDNLFSQWTHHTCVPIKWCNHQELTENAALIQQELFAYQWHVLYWDWQLLAVLIFISMLEADFCGPRASKAKQLYTVSSSPYVTRKVLVTIGGLLSESF